MLPKHSPKVHTVYHDHLEWI